LEWNKLIDEIRRLVKADSVSQYLKGGKLSSLSSSSTLSIWSSFQFSAAAGVTNEDHQIPSESAETNFSLDTGAAASSHSLSPQQSIDEIPQKSSQRSKIFSFLSFSNFRKSKK
jgi:hypothetical protein